MVGVGMTTMAAMAPGVVTKHPSWFTNVAITIRAAHGATALYVGGSEKH